MKNIGIAWRCYFTVTLLSAALISRHVYASNVNESSRTIVPMHHRIANHALQSFHKFSDGGAQVIDTLYAGYKGAEQKYRDNDATRDRQRDFAIAHFLIDAKNIIEANTSLHDLDESVRRDIDSLGRRARKLLNLHSDISLNEYILPLVFGLIGGVGTNLLLYGLFQGSAAPIISTASGATGVAVTIGAHRMFRDDRIRVNTALLADIGYYIEFAVSKLLNGRVGIDRMWVDKAGENLSLPDSNGVFRAHSGLGHQLGERDLHPVDRTGKRRRDMYAALVSHELPIDHRSWDGIRPRLLRLRELERVIAAKKNESLSSNFSKFQRHIREWARMGEYVDDVVRTTERRIEELAEKLVDHIAELPDREHDDVPTREEAYQNALGQASEVKQAILGELTDIDQEIALAELQIVLSKVEPRFPLPKSVDWIQNRLNVLQGNRENLKRAADTLNDSDFSQQWQTHLSTAVSAKVEQVKISNTDKVAEVYGLGLSGTISALLAMQRQAVTPAVVDGSLAELAELGAEQELKSKVRVNDDGYVVWDGSSEDLATLFPLTSALQIFGEADIRAALEAQVDQSLSEGWAITGEQDYEVGLALARIQLQAGQNNRILSALQRFQSDIH